MSYHHVFISKASAYDVFIQPICEIRRAQVGDIEELRTLVTPVTMEYFGDADLHDIIHRCLYSIVAVNSIKRLVAVMSFHTYPNIPALPPSCWESWIQKLYNLDNISPKNTMWMHYMAFDGEYTYIFLKPMLSKIFIEFPTLLNLLTVELPGVHPLDILEDTFTRIMPVGYYNPRTVQCLMLTLRYSYVNKYKIRLAVEEDNDDIIPLIDSQTPRLKEMYGEYYVSELLARYSEYMNRKIIVAEYEEKVAAVIFLNGDVNYKKIVEHFSLEPFFSELEEIPFVNRHSSESTISLQDIKPESRSEVHDEAVYTLEADSTESTITKHLTNADIARLNIISSSDDMMVLTVQNISDAADIGSLRSGTQSTEPEPEEEKVDDSETEIADIDLDTYGIDDETLEKHIVIEFLQLKNSAFSLEVVAADEEHEQMVMCDILEASFQSFPEKSICLLSMPSTQPDTPLFKYFIRVSPKSCSIYPHELYILHKNAIASDLTVRKAKQSEFQVIDQFLMKIPKTDHIRECIEVSLFEHNSEYTTILLFNLNVIVGLAVLRYISDQDLYFAYYQIYKYTDYRVHRHDRFGVIEECVYSPIFVQYSQLFLKEIHRLTDTTILFYKMYKADITSHTRNRPLSHLLRQMLPIPPRYLPDYSMLSTDSYVTIPSFLMTRASEPYALFMSTPRMCSLPRLDVNSRIVVVGASNTCLAFMQNLIFQYNSTMHVRYTNLTMVYERGLRDFTGMSRFAPMMMVNTGRYTPCMLTTICYRCHMNYCNGSMTAINRKNKYITINYEKILPYDYLFLMCGLQFHSPYCEGTRPREKVIKCPVNVFLINKYRDAEESFQKLYSIIENKRNYTVIVYGSALPAYCCVATLQNMKIPVANIVFVESFPDAAERPCMDCFNNTDLYTAVHNVIANEKITVYRSYYFSSWEYDAETKCVTKAEFQSRQAIVNLECVAMYFFSKKEVDFKTFTAVNSAGLVYDGRLVIGPDCRTNDPAIFAAGPMTKYSRRYFADNYVHEYYDSHEIGERLSRHMGAQLLPGGLDENPGDPIFEELKKKEKDKLVPQYTNPLFFTCVLPGRMNYFDICSPGKPVPYEIAAVSKDFGHVFVTGDLTRFNNGEDPEYFRIYFNKYFIVNQITCYTRRKIDINNYKHIWGKHEAMLKGLFLRHEMNVIKSFYDYFRLPYFCALFIDSFYLVEEKLNTIVNLLTAEDGDSLIEDLTRKIDENKWRKLKGHQEKEIMKRFTNSGYHTLMIETVMNFIGENIAYLPVYAHPLVTNVLLHNCEESPLFMRPHNKDE